MCTFILCSEPQFLLDLFYPFHIKIFNNLILWSLDTACAASRGFENKLDLKCLYDRSKGANSLRTSLADLGAEGGQPPPPNTILHSLERSYNFKSPFQIPTAKNIEQKTQRKPWKGKNYLSVQQLLCVPKLTFVCSGTKNVNAVSSGTDSAELKNC